MREQRGCWDYLTESSHTICMECIQDFLSLVEDGGYGDLV